MSAGAACCPKPYMLLLTLPTQGFRRVGREGKTTNSRILAGFWLELSLTRLNSGSLVTVLDAMAEAFGGASLSSAALASYVSPQQTVQL